MPTIEERASFGDVVSQYISEFQGLPLRIQNYRDARDAFDSIGKRFVNYINRRICPVPQNHRLRKLLKAPENGRSRQDIFDKTYLTFFPKVLTALQSLDRNRSTAFMAELINGMYYVNLRRANLTGDNGPAAIYQTVNGKTVYEDPAANLRYNMSPYEQYSQLSPTDWQAIMGYVKKVSFKDWDKKFQGSLSDADMLAFKRIVAQNKAKVNLRTLEYTLRYDPNSSNFEKRGETRYPNTYRDVRDRFIARERSKAAVVARQSKARTATFASPLHRGRVYREKLKAEMKADPAWDTFFEPHELNPIPNTDPEPDEPFDPIMESIIAAGVHPDHRERMRKKILLRQHQQQDGWDTFFEPHELNPTPTAPAGRKRARGKAYKKARPKYGKRNYNKPLRRSAPK